MNLFDNEEDKPELMLDESGKVTLKPKQEMGPPVSAASTPVQYDRIASDESGITKAKDDADHQKLMASVFEGISTAFAGPEKTNKSFFQGMRADADNKVSGAKSERAQKLKDLLDRSNLQREDTKFGWEQSEQKEKDEYNKPGSQVSLAANATGLSRVDQAIAEGAKVGADISSLKLIREKLAKGELSARNVKEMGGLGDYKDLLNNQAAMSRILQQGKQDDKRLQSQNEAEDRRLNKLKSDREESARRQISTDPFMKEAAGSKIALDKAAAMTALDNGVADEALLVSWQKGMDPISVVRESEFARTQAGAGVVQRVDMYIKQAIGEGRLTPVMRKQINEAVKELQVAYRPYAASKLQTIDSQIREYGLNPENVYGSFQKELAGQDTNVGAAPVQTPGNTSVAPAPPTNTSSLTTTESEMLAKAEAAVAKPETPAEVKASAQKVIDKLRAKQAKK
jgi:hypothetical protein